MESARCRAFLSSVNAGSFTAAGKELDYTPSGVSQLVKALEDELGLILLSRKNKGVSMTREGERIYPQILEYIECENSMMKAAEEILNLSSGTVTIASFSSIAAKYLPRVIKGFSEKYRGITLKIIEAAKYRIEELINDNTADIAFCSEPESISCDFIPLMEDHLVAVLPGNHRYAKAKAFPLSACGEEDLIMPAKGNDLDVLKILKENEIPFNVRYSTMEDITAAHMVSEELGISITNESAVDPSKDGEYVIVPVSPVSRITLGIAVPSVETMSPAVKKFMDYAACHLTES